MTTPAGPRNSGPSNKKKIHLQMNYFEVFGISADDQNAQAPILNYIRIFYVPYLNDTLNMGKDARYMFHSKITVTKLKDDLRGGLAQLPAHFKAHFPDDASLTEVLYEILLQTRRNDPRWYQIMTINPDGSMALGGFQANAPGPTRRPNRQPISHALLPLAPNAPIPAPLLQIAPANRAAHRPRAGPIRPIVPYPAPATPYSTYPAPPPAPAPIPDYAPVSAIPALPEISGLSPGTLDATLPTNMDVDVPELLTCLSPGPFNTTIPNFDDADMPELPDISGLSPCTLNATLPPSEELENLPASPLTPLAPLPTSRSPGFSYATTGEVLPRQRTGSDDGSESTLDSGAIPGLAPLCKRSFIPCPTIISTSLFDLENDPGFKHTGRMEIGAADLPASSGLSPGTINAALPIRSRAPRTVQEALAHAEAFRFLDFGPASSEPDDIDASKPYRKTTPPGTVVPSKVMGFPPPPKRFGQTEDNDSSPPAEKKRGSPKDGTKQAKRGQ
jgi:hypothetical protein